MNHVTAESAAEAPNVVIGTFMVNSHPAIVLFDTGATHSFISKSFAEQQPEQYEEGKCNMNHLPLLNTFFILHLILYAYKDFLATLYP